MWRTAKIYNFKTKKFENKKIWERDDIVETERVKMPVDKWNKIVLESFSKLTKEEQKLFSRSEGEEDDNT